MFLRNISTLFSHSLVTLVTTCVYKCRHVFLHGLENQIETWHSVYLSLFFYLSFTKLMTTCMSRSASTIHVLPIIHVSMPIICVDYFIVNSHILTYNSHSEDLYTILSAKTDINSQSSH